MGEELIRMQCCGAGQTRDPRTAGLKQLLPLPPGTAPRYLGPVLQRDEQALLLHALFHQRLHRVAILAAQLRNRALEVLRGAAPAPAGQSDGLS